ncbi:MAG: FAD-dependent oxidoreductase [Deltaproteobacteria bacterium]|nr:FAD-dependent oxidoreductase [Deltaproteobacteria bacterium]MBW2120345.1 FAD-dependent oxidoreductase [Deltaproteobacteria bacterium]
MGDIVFSSWHGRVIDNRGKPPEEFEEVTGLDLPLDYDGELRIKALMGWDGLAIRDPDVNVVDMCRVYMEAVQKESCGKCVPCRVGTQVILTALKRIADGRGTRADLEEIESLGRIVQESAKCQIGQTGTVALLHCLRYYRDDFLDLIENNKKAPSGTYRTKTVAPCSNACPAHLDIPTYVEYVRENRFEESLDVIRKMTCFPGTLGRVCIRPCESSCRRANLDEPISIKYLKRFVADWELERRHTPPIEKPDTTRDDPVAVVGAGPAGLSCAYYLAQQGYPVTVFERFGAPGGMAAWGIPDYRLPREILNREVELVQAMGVEILYNTEVGKDITLKEIAQKYKAIFLGVGAQGNTSMRVEGEDAGYQGFIPGVKYLLEINQGKDPYPEGKKVVVVGGGNVAIDCVRSSLRIGKTDVNLVYRRSRKEMPADEVEIRDAEEEEVKFHFLCNPVKVVAKDNKVVGVECIRMELGEPDESGRRRPIPIPGSEFFIDCDIVIPAIGQAVDLGFLEGMKEIETTRWKTLVVNPKTFETTRKGIFSAGDCVTGPDVLVRAAGNGKRAADKIDKYLRGMPVEPSEEERLEDLMAAIGVYDKEEMIGAVGGQERKRLRMLEPEQRRQTFEEVEKGFPVPVAKEEAERCLRCYRVSLVALGPKSQG